MDLELWILPSKQRVAGSSPAGIANVYNGFLFFPETGVCKVFAVDVAEAFSQRKIAVAASFL